MAGKTLATFAQACGLDVPPSTNFAIPSAPIRIGMILLLLLDAGCGRHTPFVQGFLSSSGGELGIWRSQPAGCSRAPFDGLPLGQSSSVITFLWQDQTFMDPVRQTHDDPSTEQAPVRLEVAHRGAGYVASLATAKTDAATRLDEHVCSVLRLETQEGAKVIREGKPTLRGRLQLDCTLKGGRLTADLTFADCGY